MSTINDVLIVDSMESLAAYAGWVRAYAYDALSNVVLCKFVGRTREAICEAFDESEYGGEENGNELVFMVVKGCPCFLRGDDYQIVYLGE